MAQYIYSGHCPLCESLEHRVTAKLVDIYITKCLDCGLLFSARDNTARLKGDYFSVYDLDKYVSYYKQFRENGFKKHFALIESMSSKGAILDLGCSFGWFLKLAKDSGWKAYGLDSSAEIANLSRNMYNLEILIGDAGAIDIFHTEFNVITLWNVLEHISKPSDTLKLLKEKMSDNGIIVISVPNVDGLFARLAFFLYRISFGRFDFALKELYQVNNPYMHLFYFSQKTLARLLKRCGFTVIKVIKQPIINSAGIRQRIEMDKSLSVRNNMVKNLLVAVTRAIFYISELLKMQDEIVVYARKEK